MMTLAVDVCLLAADECLLDVFSASGLVDRSSTIRSRYASMGDHIGSWFEIFADGVYMTCLLSQYLRVCECIGCWLLSDE
jgi:hypothetical protein